MKIKVDCALSDAYLRLMVQPQKALQLLEPYYKQDEVDDASDKFSVSFVCPDGLVDDDGRIATKVYFHLGKIFR